MLVQSNLVQSIHTEDSSIPSLFDCFLEFPCTNYYVSVCNSNIKECVDIWKLYTENPDYEHRTCKRIEKPNMVYNYFKGQWLGLHCCKSPLIFRG